MANSYSAGYELVKVNVVFTLPDGVNQKNFEPLSI